jgi:hypothetical protein
LVKARKKVKKSGWHGLFKLCHSTEVLKSFSAVLCGWLELVNTGFRDPKSLPAITLPRTQRFLWMIFAVGSWRQVDFVQCQVLAQHLSGGELLRLALGGFDLIVGSTEKRRSWPVGESMLRSFAGACWSCGGLADWSLIPSGIGECCSRHTLSLDRSRHRVQVFRRSEYP